MHLREACVAVVTACAAGADSVVANCARLDDVVGSLDCRGPLSNATTHAEGAPLVSAANVAVDFVAGCEARGEAGAGLVYISIAKGGIVGSFTGLLPFNLRAQTLSGPLALVLRLGPGDVLDGLTRNSGVPVLHLFEVLFAGIFCCRLRLIVELVLVDEEAGHMDQRLRELALAREEEGTYLSLKQNL